MSKSSVFTLTPGALSLSEIDYILQNEVVLELSSDCIAAINASTETVNTIITKGDTVYGVNTGFGHLAESKISHENLLLLQKNLVLSHAAGVGELLSEDIIRLVLLLKINSLARGYSGVRLEFIDSLIQLFNHHLYPCIPCQGSLGASGDLAPLAHIGACLLGEGKAWLNGKKLAAKEALEKIGLPAFQFAAKEGVALLNGTQVSTALAVFNLFQAEQLLAIALVSGSMTLDSAKGSAVALDARIQEVRGLKPQQDVASIMRELLAGSEIMVSHQNCPKVQDPYSLRCQPQVMGACLQQLRNAREVLAIEINAVTDNPLIFGEEILSGGNFHAEPVAMIADNMALAIAEIGALAERRIALLMDSHFSDGLPPFLVENSGLNSGFMIAHYTATSLASENKSLAHPACVDSLPTSANQEDHVSMSAFAARRLGDMVANTRGILAIELLVAAQAIDLRAPLKTSKKLINFHSLIRNVVDFYKHDRYMSPDINSVIELLNNGFASEIRRSLLQTQV